MADIFEFYVYDDRSIQFALAEPIMLEDKDVTEFRFRIPKSLNGFDMSSWVWWFVYENAAGIKYSVPMVLVDDADDPENYSLSSVSIGYGMSGYAGKLRFAIEVVNADSGGNVLNEWHTKTYDTIVEKTLQGNQVEYSETEADIISALIQRAEELIQLGGGSPVTASTVSAMLDTTKVYLYTGNESGYIFGNWYYYNGSAWTSGGEYGSGAITVDSVLSESSTNPVQNKVIYEALQDSGGLTQTEKNLILELFSKAAYADDDAGTAYDALETIWTTTSYSVSWSGNGYTKGNNATSVIEGSTFTSTVTANTGFTITSVTATMGGATVTGAWSGGTVTIPNVTGNIVITVVTSQRTVSSISAVYTQSGTVYDTDTLDSLKSDLVVTATFSDSTTGVIAAADYTLSGTLTVGTSTITVSYGGKTDTFSVTVTSAPVSYLYNWDFTQSLVDSVEGQEVTLGAGSGVSNATRDSSGLSFNAATQYAYLGEISPVGKTFEIDVSSFDFKGSTSYHIRFLSNSQYASSTSKGLGAIIWRKDTNQGWTSYGWNSETSQTAAWSASLWNSNLAGSSSSVLNAFSAKTVKIVYHSDGHTKDMYLDNDFIGTISDVWFNEYGSVHHSDKIYIGGQMSVNQGSGDQCYDMTITGIRIYENNE